MSAKWFVITSVILAVLKPTLSSEIKGSTYCEFYNEKLCEKSPETCPEKEKCVLDHPASRNHCFVTWHFDKATNKSTVKQKGCFLDGKQCYDQAECIDTSDSRRNNIFFCCCSGDMCNKNFAWDPNKPIEAHKSVSPRLDQIEEKESSTTIAVETEVKNQQSSLKIPLKFGDEMQGTSIVSLGANEAKVEEISRKLLRPDEAKVDDTSSKSPRADETKVQEAENAYQKGMIVFISIGATLFVAIVLGSIYWWFNHRNSKKFATAICNRSSRASLKPYLGAIELLDVKARGNFGTVWKARMADELVAAKIMSTQEEQSWRTEHEVFKLPNIKHQNLLAFIGGEKREHNLTTEFWLVTAYHEKGSLCDYLKDNVLTWPQLCRIAESMLRGLMHLHDEIPGNGEIGLKPAVAHRDVKSQNILLKADMTACIADFGLSLIFHPDKSIGKTHARVGTRRYMAPEVLEGAINCNRDSFLKIDMYACALVLWELVSRCMAQDAPVEKYSLPYEAEVGLNPSIDDMLRTVIVKGQRPEIAAKWRNHPGLASICETIEECWDTEPESRLSASCVLERIVLLNGSDSTKSSTTIVIDEDIPVNAKEVFDTMRNAYFAK